MLISYCVKICLIIIIKIVIIIIMIMETLLNYFLF